jgi:hypothetical protein
MRIRAKSQDFAVAAALYLKASHDPAFPPSASPIQATCLGYVAVECKTNLDKTMFQEACATAHDVKSAVTGARYYLLCEWLDMTPLSTAPTDIDEVLILRKAKRIDAAQRQAFGAPGNRRDKRTVWADCLAQNPLRAEVFARLADHVRRLLSREGPAERDVLEAGFF